MRALVCNNLQYFAIILFLRGRSRCGNSCCCFSSSFSSHSASGSRNTFLKILFCGLLERHFSISPKKDHILAYIYKSNYSVYLIVTNLVWHFENFSNACLIQKLCTTINASTIQYYTLTFIEMSKVDIPANATKLFQLIPIDISNG